MITIGLLTNSVCSVNYGVNALSISNVLIIDKVVKSMHGEARYVLFGEVEESDNSIAILNNIELLSDINVCVATELEFRKPQSWKNFSRALKKCDIVFDTSGGDSYSDIYGNNRILHQVVPKVISIWMKKDIVLTPQTIGPFENILWKKICCQIMKRSRAVFTRDNISYQLCSNELRIVNVYNTTDMAMVLPYKKNKIGSFDSLRIGLNVSGLLYNGGYNGNNQFELNVEYPKLIDMIIELLTKELKCSVLLVPHVITTGMESDNEVCEKLKHKYPQVEYEGYFDGPIETKSYISTMDCFIGSRMHSTIAAISTGVPVIPLSYSRKFEGLFNSIDYKECVNLRECNEEETLNIIREKLDELPRLRESVDFAKKIADKKICLYEEQLKLLLEKYA